MKKKLAFKKGEKKSQFFRWNDYFRWLTCPATGLKLQISDIKQFLNLVET
jgi:hypothetical protein